MQLSLNAANQTQADARLRRTLLIAAALVVALAATSLWKLAELPAESSIAGGERAQAISVGRTHYAEIAHFLRTGDSPALQTSLAPGFVDHHPWPGFSGDQVGYLASLAALRSTLPGGVLTAVMVEFDHGLMTYHLTLAAPPGASLPAAAGATPLQEWRYSELLRMRSGQIVERWGPELPFALNASQTSWQGVVPVGGQSLIVSDWESVDGMKVYLGQVAIIVLEGVATVEPSYKLDVVRNGSALIEREDATRSTTVGPGDIVISRYVVTVTSEGPAHLLIVQMSVDVTARERAGSIGAVDGVLPDGATLQQVSVQRTALGMGFELDPAGQGVLRIIQVSEGELLDSATSTSLAGGSMTVVPADGTTLKAVAPTAAWVISVDIS